MFYDFWVEHWDNETGKLLKKLGFDGACLFNVEGESKSLVLLGGKAVKGKQQVEADVIFLQSEDENVQRAAVKAASVDAIRAFVTYPVVREMAERNVALVVCFSDLLNASNMRKTLALMRRSVALAKKHKAPIMICSGAKSYLELRSASDLIAFGEVLGLDKGNAKGALSRFQKELIERTKLKKEGLWVAPGMVLKNGSQG
jgi:RNase P/RNase MRP subunit p30